MSTTTKPFYNQSHCVFINNIPYDATEQQVRQVFQQAGLIVNFELLYDRDTGRPTGGAKCEYPDPETAQSAVRNFNGHELMSRQLWVTPMDRKSSSGGGDRAAGGSGHAQTTYHGTGTEVKPPQILTDFDIHEFTSSYSPETQLHILAEFKAMAQAYPDKAKQLLLDYPQLSHAIMRMMVDTNSISLTPPQPAAAAGETSTTTATGADRSPSAGPMATPASGGSSSSSSTTSAADQKLIIQRVIAWYKGLPQAEKDRYRPLFSKPLDRMTEDLKLFNLPKDTITRLLVIKKMVDQGVNLPFI